MKNLTWGILYSIFALLTIITFTQCGGSGKTEGKTKKGLEYTIFSKTPNAKKAVEGDFVTFFVTVKNFKDSILQPRQEVKAYEVKKDTSDKFNELFLLMKAGDSLVIKESTNSLLKEQEAFVKKRIAETKKQIEELKTGKDTKMPDSSRTQYIATLERDIKQATEQMEKPNPMLPKDKYIAYYFVVKEVMTKKQMEESKRLEQEKKDKEASEQIGKDETLIKEYAEKNKLKTEKTASGLHYIIEKQGEGDTPKAGEMIAVNYKGQLLDGKVFDTSIKEESEKAGLKQPGRTFEPLKFAVGQAQVIKGWDEGLMLFKKGGKGILLIPSGLAYGARGAGKDIPANSVLRFDVELVDIIKSTEQKK